MTVVWVFFSFLHFMLLIVFVSYLIFMPKINFPYQKLLIFGVCECVCVRARDCDDFGWYVRYHHHYNYEAFSFSRSSEKVTDSAAAAVADAIAFIVRWALLIAIKMHILTALIHMYFMANQIKFTVHFGLIKWSISHIFFRSHNYEYTALLIIADYLRNRCKTKKKLYERTRFSKF